MWAQANDVYGASYRSPEICRTVVVGKKPELVSCVLHVLSYFVRCGEIFTTEPVRAMPPGVAPEHGPQDTHDPTSSTYPAPRRSSLASTSSTAGTTFPAARGRMPRPASTSRFTPTPTSTPTASAPHDAHSATSRRTPIPMVPLVFSPTPSDAVLSSTPTHTPLAFTPATAVLSSTPTPPAQVTVAVPPNPPLPPHSRLASASPAAADHLHEDIPDSLSTFRLARKDAEDQRCESPSLALFAPPGSPRPWEEDGAGLLSAVGGLDRSSVDFGPDKRNTEGMCSPVMSPIPFSTVRALHSSVANTATADDTANTKVIRMLVTPPPSPPSRHDPNTTLPGPVELHTGSHSANHPSSATGITGGDSANTPDATAERTKRHEGKYSPELASEPRVLPGYQPASIVGGSAVKNVPATAASASAGCDHRAHPAGAAIGGGAASACKKYDWEILSSKRREKLEARREASESHE